MEGYNMIHSQGDYVLKQGNYHTVEGDLFNAGTNVDIGPGTVTIVTSRLYSAPTATQKALFQALYAFTALHETFHLGKRGGYTDDQIATAIAEVDSIALPMKTKDGATDAINSHKSGRPNRCVRECVLVK